MNITLTPELEPLIQTKVARGEYGSADAFFSQAAQRSIDEQRGEKVDPIGIRPRIAAADRAVAGVRE